MEKIKSEENKITISTVHRCKGLEWPIVFLIGLADYYFPVNFAKNNKS